MAVHSERESYRKVIELRTPEGHVASLIIMRRTANVWVTFNGAITTTVTLSDPQAGQLIDAVTAARTPR
ncbi:MAG: hypothetical protein LC799_16485 [Actinobacteria bacterium]|nr:hypothetical protein [Actinomycetota bacterium]